MTSDVRAGASVAQLTELLGLADGDLASLDAELLLYFKDRNRDDLIPIIQRNYADLASQPTKSEGRQRLQGAYGLLLGAHYAEIGWDETRGEVSGTYEDSVSEIFEDPTVLSYIWRVYGLDPADAPRKPEHFSLHALGTTSLIFRLRRPRDAHYSALKILKPWYLGQRAVERATESYEEEFGHLANAPAVIESGKRFILMEFIEGRPLRRFFMTSLSDAEESEHLRALGRVLAILCETLAGYAARPQRDGGPVSHGDISSDNVLVVREEPLRLMLIDFGVNYMLTERIGDLNQFRRVRKRAPVEALKVGYSPAPVSDIYSLGVLLLEGLVGEDLDRLEIEQCLDKVYRQYPFLGSLLDDLVEPTASRRASTIVRRPDAFHALAQQIQAEISLSIEMRRYQRERNRWVALLVADGIVPGFRQILGRALRAQEPQLPRQPGFLGLFTGLAESSLAMVAALFGILFSAHVLHGRIAWPDYADVVTFMPGLIVGLSCAHVAARYYVSIFSGVTARDLPSPTARVAEHSMRLNSMIFLAPIVTAFVFDLSIWPLAVAVGVAFVALNDWLCGRLCEEAYREMDGKNLRVSPDMKTARDQFGGWAVISAIYVACLLGGWGLLTAGILRDEGFYALLVAGVVNLKMSLFNCGKDAWQMRNGIDRFIRGYRRSLVPADEAAIPGTAP